MPHTRKRCQSLSVQGSMIPMYPPPPIYGLTHCVYLIYPPPPPPGGLTHCVYLIYPPQRDWPIVFTWYIPAVVSTTRRSQSCFCGVRFHWNITGPINSCKRAWTNHLRCIQVNSYEICYNFKWYLSKFKKCSSNI